MISMELKDQKVNVRIIIKIKMDIIMNNVIKMTLLMYKYNNKDQEIFRAFFGTARPQH